MKRIAALAPILFLISCTFDYGEFDASERTMPDLIMENVEYVRVKSADPILRFRAERAERYEKQGIMNLEHFSFEQFSGRSEEINTSGSAGFASIDMKSRDILIDNGVRIEVESDDIILETVQLNWIDSQRLLFSGTENEVNVLQKNSTNFTGLGLRVDTRNRTWEFSGGVSGAIELEDIDEEE
ncbi:MAG: LPS export ABC transporter periplasmic protein LptC [Treponema sp.]|nr:LPS export ABC transporter periplasmic protein LptC [Treponema sp.]